eukprot:COSAG02_NODE_31310_length_535_cov_19.561927_2_plen_72_part_00
MLSVFSILHTIPPQARVVPAEGQTERDGTAVRRERAEPRGRRERERESERERETESRRGGRECVALEAAPP